ncbi:transcriptional regulator [Paenibacillus sp. BIHB 4019]|uniref:Transcriptional regulator n=1 Tax=Paenibacillus sp. BIHB 4019 TaxID=1870819 RepID=A0A1B2DET9_9BACL|nr:TetR/AcrR family transcriptional regulator [Paenibacillus sp. BIHB 4019]ANY66227.1 transcriptional regulator [Paenibacillus sp. BIHB 4019]
MNTQAKRLLILSAASTVVKTHGAEKLTLEAVAKEAGISKGGLLHHFPNKQALIYAMVDESTSSFFADLHQRAMNESKDTGKWSRAYIDSTFEDVQDGNMLNAAIIASLFSNPDILAKLQSEYSIWQKQIENDGIDPVQATIIRLAVDGLWFSDILGVIGISNELRDQVLQYLTNMTNK